jgi:hypothetical protein
MTMTGKPVELNLDEWRREGVALGARAMLVVWDQFPWPPEPYPVFVMSGENIAERFAAFDGAKWQRVQAVHLLPRPEPENG